MAVNIYNSQKCFIYVGERLDEQRLRIIVLPAGGFNTYYGSFLLSSPVAGAAAPNITS